jgi:transketolase
LLALSRQNLPTRRATSPMTDIRRGGYVLSEALAKRKPCSSPPAPKSSWPGRPGGTGRRRHCRRVVSMPSTNVFDRQDAAYRRPPCWPLQKSRASPSKPAHPDFWRKYVGLDGAVIGIDRFGESAPAGELFEVFGFTVVAAVNVA